MKRRLVALLGVAVIALAGCGNAQSSTSTSTSASPAGKREARIIPLTGDVAEIVFKLGLADKVVGVDLSAMGLPEARGKKQIGYQRALAAEGILSLKPTVLVGTEEAGPPPVIEQLKGAGVPVVLVPTGAASVDEVPGKIEQVAQAVGEPGKGATLAAATKAEIDAAKATVKADAKKPRVAFLYLRGQSKTYQLGGAGTRADAMITAAGGEDAGTAAGVKGFKPITAEAMVAAAPEIILVMKMGLDSVGGEKGLLALPGVAQTPAGKNRRIVALDDLELLGMGPRTGQALTKLVTAFQP
ncbi:heme/hemin ABC transporter substrate-binding protein [Nonomuraea typhae]|uniref:heme/hemin ABC transporter substrate-binding protein n=1 Tax=Nonomuraea typhae TaxID=2603600 RepID=UPI0012FB96D3|nr:ABC transporter substrate-binding protein [Nonomuraea typhae]